MIDTTYVRMFEAIAKVVRMKPEEIAFEAQLDSLGMKSVGVTALMLELEEQFSIKFPDRADIIKRFETFATVRDLDKVIRTLIAEQKEA